MRFLPSLFRKLLRRVLLQARHRRTAKRVRRFEALEIRVPLASDIVFGPIAAGNANQLDTNELLSPSAYYQEQAAPQWNGPLQFGQTAVQAAKPSQANFSAARSLQAIAKMDVDQDGWLDVLSRDVTTGELVVASGGAFANTQNNWGTWNPNQSIELYWSGDFNGDGSVDVLGVDGQDHLWLAANQGNRFSVRYWGQVVDADWQEMQVFNINQDGYQDLVAVEQGDHWTVIPGSATGLASQQAWMRETPFHTWAPEHVQPLASNTLVGEAEDGTDGSDSGGGIITQGTLQALVDLDIDDSSGASGNDFLNGFTEEDGYVRLLDSDFLLNDLAEDDIVELVVQPVGGVPDGPAEFVIFRRSGGVSSVRLDGSETTTFTHEATDGFPIEYQFDPTQNAVVWRPENAATIPVSTVRLLMDGLRYYNTDDDPDDSSPRLFDIFVRDNSAVQSTVGQATINLTPVNDPPSLDLDQDNSSGAAPEIVGLDSVDLTFVSSTQTTGALFNSDTVNVAASAMFSSGLTATDPNFVAKYFERSEAIRLDDNTTANLSFSSGTAPTGTLIYLHDVDQSESVTIASSSGTPRLVEQLETISGETTNLPVWDSATGVLSGDTVNGVGGATIFDISGFTDLSLSVGTPGTLEFGFITPGVQPINYETTWTEGGPAIGIVDSDVDAGDVDNATIQDVSITLTNGQIGDQLVADLTSIANAGLTVTGSPNLPLTSPGPLILTLAGPVSHAEIESVLRQIQFENTSSTPNTTDRVVNFTLR
ncbi:MAG: VCBS repeat-containing protein, partial [Planctomycetota bacterium]